MPKFDYEKVKQSCKLFLEGIGEDPSREGLLETPDRFARMYQILLGGYDSDNTQHVKVFTAESTDMVTVANVNFFSYCEHHIQPFIGKLSIAYIPGEKIIGVSKLVRLARTHAKKLQVQERLVKEIADDVERLLKPQGVAVQLKAQHFCMALRGVRSQESVMVTTAVRGLFKTDEKARAEFLETIKGNHDVFGY
jgi:GTP cyclohydrolase I